MKLEQMVAELTESHRLALHKRAREAAEAEREAQREQALTDYLEALKMPHAPLCEGWHDGDAACTCHRRRVIGYALMYYREFWAGGV